MSTFAFVDGNTNKYFNTVYAKSKQCGCNHCTLARDGKLYSCEFLTSYDTIVAGFVDGVMFYRGYWSRTTARHISIFADYAGLSYADFKAAGMSKLAPDMIEAVEYMNGCYSYATSKWAGTINIGM